MLIERLLRTRPLMLFVGMVLIPTLLAGCGFGFALFLGASWQGVLPFFVIPAVLSQWMLFLAWEWVVATQLVRVSGERPGIHVRTFKLAFASVPLALALLFAAAWYWPTAPEILLMLVSAVGTAGLLYGWCFVASVVTRADLGSQARTWQVVVAAVGLWACSPLTACLLQHRVNRVSFRVSAAS